MDIPLVETYYHTDVAGKQYSAITYDTLVQIINLRKKFAFDDFRLLMLITGMFSFGIIFICGSIIAACDFPAAVTFTIIVVLMIATPCLVRLATTKFIKNLDVVAAARTWLAFKRESDRLAEGGSVLYHH